MEDSFEVGLADSEQDTCGPTTLGGEAKSDVEGFGAEGQTLYKTYSESFGTPAIGALLHLTQVVDLSK